MNEQSACPAISADQDDPLDRAGSKTRPARHLPGEEGVWVFIFGDMMIFSLFFGTFLYYRAQNLDIYLASQAKLNPHYGALNAVLLLSSSWFVVLALQAIRTQRVRAAPWLFGLGWLCGAGFVVVKFVEYGEKIRDGITVTTNEFFMFYYVYTGIHFMHVIIGMAVLSYLLLKSRRATAGSLNVSTFESGAAYWHMVDLLWIVLFPLLYLVR
jgi:nitric oxide reductase NorE protein